MTSTVCLSGPLTDQVLAVPDGRSVWDYPLPQDASAIWSHSQSATCEPREIRTVRYRLVSVCWQARIGQPDQWVHAWAADSTPYAKGLLELIATTIIVLAGWYGPVAAFAGWYGPVAAS